MHVRILKADGGGYLDIFGVNDFQANSGGGIRVWFGTDSAVDDDERHRDIDGYVISSVDESSYNFQGAYETIGDIGVADDTELLVVSSPKYPYVNEAARTLKNETDYTGDFTFTTPQATA